MNKSNPLEDISSIGFVLLQAKETQLNVCDFKGKSVWSIAKEFSVVYYEEKLNLAENFSPGVYYYELLTAYGSKTKSMVLI